MVFFPNDDKSEAEGKAIYEEVIAEEGMKLVGWRSVPVAHEVVGRFAKATQPRIAQVRTLLHQPLVDFYVLTSKKAIFGSVHCGKAFSFVAVATQLFPCIEARCRNALSPIRPCR